MEKRYVVVGQNRVVSDPMSREDAINRVMDLASEQKTYYIVSEAEGERIKGAGTFNQPKW